MAWQGLVGGNVGDLYNLLIYLYLFTYVSVLRETFILTLAMGAAILCPCKVRSFYVFLESYASELEEATTR